MATKQQEVLRLRTRGMKTLMASLWRRLSWRHCTNLIGMSRGAGRWEGREGGTLFHCWGRCISVQT